MTTKLMNYFPMIKTREEVLGEIHSNARLCETFTSWNQSQQDRFFWGRR